jgi:acid phosphatase family membrane protein YuiD
MHVIGLIALASGLFAQLLKVFVVAAREGRWRWSLLFASGGMPSSHTATVTTLTLLVAFREGIGSPLFSVCFIFGLYVVFEATGLRQEVGKQARLLNDLVDEMISTHHFDRTRLRELVGHTWGEVGGGFVCGVVVYLAARLVLP